MADQAVRASIIEGLLEDRDRKGNPKEPYLVRDDTELVPTPKAMALIAFLEESEIEFLVSPQMTGEWEQKLLRMEKDEYRRSEFMGEITDVSPSMVNIIRGKAEALPAPVAKQLAAPCPKCSAAIHVNGRAYECSGCDFKVWSEIASRKLSPTEAEALIGKGRTGLLEGLKSKAGRKFSATLNLNTETRKVDFEFEERK